MKKEIKEKFSQNKEKMEFYDQDGTKQNSKKKKSRKPAQRPAKIKPIYLTYESDRAGEDCFFDVLQTIKNNCPIVKTFLDQLGDIESFDDYVAKTSKQIATTPPQLVSKKNIHTCFSVSANRVHIRLEGDVAFTVEIKYQVLNRVAHILTCTGTIIMYAKNDDLYNGLIEAGWVVVEK